MSRMVHPHPEYLTPVCSSYLEGDLKHLKRLPRLATPMVTAFKGLPYDQRLQKLSQFQSKIR